MAIYRILKKNGLFKGFPGEEVQAEPGPMMDAFVRGGMIQRIDVAAPKPVVREAPSRKSRKSDGDSLDS